MRQPYNEQCCRVLYCQGLAVKGSDIHVLMFRRRVDFRVQYSCLMQFFDVATNMPLLSVYYLSVSKVNCSGVARTWVMPGPSSWSLPVERRAAVITPREARKIFSSSFFSYQDGLSRHLRAPFTYDL